MAPPTMLAGEAIFVQPQEKIVRSEMINALVAALAKAQAEIGGAHKDSTNPHFKTKYADLESVWDACRIPLSNNGLAIMQTIGKDEHGMFLETILAHASGQSISSICPLIFGKNDMQGLGSAITYARRYGISALVGVCPTDDDGNAAVASTGKPNAKPAPMPDYTPPPYETSFQKFIKRSQFLVGTDKAKKDFLNTQITVDKSIPENDHKYWSGKFSELEKITAQEVEAATL